MFFDQSIAAIKSVNRWRERRVWHFDAKKPLLDFASNDYLGLATCEKSFNKAYRELKRFGLYAPRASMLVNGYTQLHMDFERLLASVCGFGRGLLVGSGFLANLALINGLVGKKDAIFIDEHYHASGRYAALPLGDRVQYFAHNNPQDLENKIAVFLESKKPFLGKIFIAIEGVYSMSGAIGRGEFASLAKRLNALLIVDEAHSSGVLGDNLLGYFDYHHLKIEKNFIKMGTLSKAYGSYGAYILADKEIISVLENRAKPIIYSTALSLFDTVLAKENFLHILAHRHSLRRKLQKRQALATKILAPLLKKEGLKTPIVTLTIPNTQRLLEAQERLRKWGYFVGAIRKPTVEVPLLRVILSLNHSQNDTIALCKKLLKVVQ